MFKNLKSKGLLTSSVIAGSLLMMGCGGEEESNASVQNSEVVLVKIAPLIKTEINGKTIDASGQFTTADETMLSFKTGGIIAKVFVKEGDKIKKGQVLAALDMSELNTLLHQAEITFEKASRDFSKVEKMLPDSSLFENSKTAFENAKQQLNTSKLNLNYWPQPHTSINGVHA